MTTQFLANPTGNVYSIEKSFSWRDRPESIQVKINEAFNNIAKDNNSQWGLFNGNNNYGICHTEETKLLLKLLEENPGQKTFNILDIGAGKFQFSKAVANFINNSPDIPNDVHFNIIGVRGEKYLGNEVLNNSKCTIYNYGAFKIENIIDAFAEREMHLENNVDLIVSRWTLRHLMDPVGTFQQIYELSKAGTGVILTDGFSFTSDKNEDYNWGTINANLIEFFEHLNTNFLMCPPSSGGLQHNEFLIKKPINHQADLPYSYVGIIDRESGQHPHWIELSKTTTSNKKVNADSYGDQWQFVGNIELCEWLVDNAAFGKEICGALKPIDWE